MLQQLRNLLSLKVWTLAAPSEDFRVLSGARPTAAGIAVTVRAVLARCVKRRASAQRLAAR